jgi:hypothetical protein
VLIIIEQNKNSQNAKKIQALGFFRMPKCFGGKNEKKKPTFITFPTRLKFSKLPKIFPSILEK